MQDSFLDRNQRHRLIGPVIRTPEVRNDGQLPNLEDVLSFLKNEIFDPEKIAYVFELGSTNAISYSALKVWAEDFTFESKLYAMEVQNVAVRIFFQTGTRGAVNSVAFARCYPDIWERSTICNWVALIHNHPDFERDESNCYPSSGDLKVGRSNTNLDMIIHKKGVVIFGVSPEYPISIPEVIKSKFVGKTIKQILGDIQLWAYLEDHIQTMNPGIAHDEVKKILYEMMGIPIQVYPWEQKEDIERIIGRINKV